MVLNNCRTCTVYQEEDSVQKKFQVKCDGDQIILLLRREQEISELSDIRIDFFDGQIGCIKTRCELAVRSNCDPSITVPWVADCEILDVIEIVEGRRSIRATMEKEAVFSADGGEGFKGVIQNISEGGIYFITTTRLQTGNTVLFTYNFFEISYEMEAVILREEDLRDGRYGYGCQFIELAVEALKDIRQYVYLRQQGLVIL